MQMVYVCFASYNAQVQKVGVLQYCLKSTTYRLWERVMENRTVADLLAISEQENAQHAAELVIAKSEKAKLAAELVVANIENAKRQSV
jgi:hypothetical protein